MGSRHVAVAALLIAVALAGCAQDGRQLSAAEAKDVWQSAFTNAESFENLEAVGIETTAEANGSQVLEYRMQVKPSQSGFLLQLSVDPSLIEEEQVSPGLVSDLAMGQTIDDGVRHFVLPDLTGNLSLRRDHVPDQEQFDDFGEVNSAVGAEQTDQNLGPDFGMHGLNDHGENITVEDVTSTTVRGKAAWTIQFSFSNATFSASGEMTFFQESKLPADGTWTIEGTGSGGGHPLFNAGEASVTIEFRYDDEVQIELPDAERAPPNIRKQQSSPQDGEISGSIAASHDEEVPLGEIELQITSEVEGSQNPTSPSPDPDQVFFTMQADQGSKSNASYELTYDDVDGDGYLSANDTYSATIKQGAGWDQRELHFLDSWSGKYAYQPGFEALAVLAAVGAAVALLRRWD